MQYLDVGEDEPLEKLCPRLLRERQSVVATPTASTSEEGALPPRSGSKSVVPSEG